MLKYECLLDGFDPTRGYYHIIIIYNNITVTITAIIISTYSNMKYSIGNLQYLNN